MRKILKIAQREYVETVKTKTFLISLLFAPVITIGIIFFTSMISKGESGPRPAVKVGVTDLSAQLAGEIETALDKHNRSKPQRKILLESLEAGSDVNSAEQRGKTELRSGGIDAYVVIEPNIIEGAGKVYFYTYKSKPANLDAHWTVQGIVNDVVVEQRCKARNISPELLAEVRNVPVERIEIGAGPEEQRQQSEVQAVMRMMIPFFFMFLIYMGIVGIGQQMLSSVIEEKNSRIIEVMLSAASPFEFMAGKIFGLGAIGLTVVGLWAAAGYGSAVWRGLDIEITGSLLFYFLIFYVLGFLLFSSMLAAIGSVCNTLKETQGLMMPIVLIFVLPLISWYKLVQSPDGVFARVLSLVPPVSPLVMILRMSASSKVPAVEIVASIALLVAALLLSMWLAAKIFRTGILMYGKRPSIREIFRWLRAS
jgi:ABC-2 type transport system permease protein